MSVITYKLGESLTHDTVIEYSMKINRMIADFRDDLCLDCSDLKHLDGDGLGLLTLLSYKLSIDNRKLMLDNVNGQPYLMLSYLSILESFAGGESCFKNCKTDSSLSHSSSSTG